MIKLHQHVVSLRDIEPDDRHFVGEKATIVTDGFVITPSAYFKFLRDNNLEIKIKNLIGAINFDRDDSLSQVCRHIKNLILKSKIPDSLVYRIAGHYIDIGSSKVRVHMSVISGDPHHAKATPEKFIDVEGDAVLFDTVRSLWSHIFEPRLVVYRNEKTLDHLKTGVSVTVEKI